jgi:hypothetical protein
MTTPPEDVDAMFGLPPLPAAASTTAAADAAAAEEAALAAEIALALESGHVAADAPDSRTDRRIEVTWPARMQLPDGRVIGVHVRNISEIGVGLVSDEDIPADTVVHLEMDVPQPDEAGRVTPVRGAIRTTYTVSQGAEVLCGGTWQASPSGVELVLVWIERLRGR